MPTITTTIAAASEGEEKNVSLWAPELLHRGNKPSGSTDTFAPAQGWYNNGNTSVDVTVTVASATNGTLNYVEFQDTGTASTTLLPGETKVPQIQYTVDEVGVGETVPVTIELATTYTESV